MEIVKLTFIGFVLGTTAVIPGFSVATMAVVFNVYDRLINVIVPNVKKFSPHGSSGFPWLLAAYAE